VQEGKKRGDGARRLPGRFLSISSSALLRAVPQDDEGDVQGRSRRRYAAEPPSPRLIDLSQRTERSGGGKRAEESRKGEEARKREKKRCLQQLNKLREGRSPTRASGALSCALWRIRNRRCSVSRELTAVDRIISRVQVLEGHIAGPYCLTRVSDLCSPVARTRRAVVMSPASKRSSRCVGSVLP